MSRALASLGRFPEAHDAFNHTMALAPANIALHAELGEALVLEAQGTVTPAAEDEFAKAPDDPRSRYYAAEAALQHDDPVGSGRRWLPSCLGTRRALGGAAWRRSSMEETQQSAARPSHSLLPSAAVEESIGATLLRARRRSTQDITVCPTNEVVIRLVV